MPIGSDLSSGKHMHIYGLGLDMHIINELGRAPMPPLRPHPLLPTGLIALEYITNIPGLQPSLLLQMSTRSLRVEAIASFRLLRVAEYRILSL